MKKLLISVVVIFALLFSVNVQAGQPLGLPRAWLAQPNSRAFGMSLDGWMEAWVRWLENGADPDARIGNVAFLPIFPGPQFSVDIKVGTALVLPVATWLGTEPDYSDMAPDDWFGDSDHIFGTLQLDGGKVIEINENYYVGPTYYDPPAILFETNIYFTQALACVILPLPPGVHELILHSEFVDFGIAFDNTWTITVVP